MIRSLRNDARAADSFLHLGGRLRANADALARDLKSSGNGESLFEFGLELVPAVGPGRRRRKEHETEDRDQADEDGFVKFHGAWSFTAITVPQGRWLRER